MKYFIPENTKSGFLFIKNSKSFSFLITVITTFSYLFDKISKIRFSSNLIPTFFLFKVRSFGAGIVTISIDLLIKEMEYPFFVVLVRLNSLFLLEKTTQSYFRVA